MAEIRAEVNDDRIYSELNHRYQFAKGTSGVLDEVEIDPSDSSIRVTVKYNLNSATFNDIVWRGHVPS